MKKISLGFSMIELLVGVAIIITSSTIVLAIILSSFRISGTNTTKENVRQNGSNALSKMSRSIQFADSFVAVNNTGEQTSMVCEAPSADTEPTQYKYLMVKYNGPIRTYSCVNNKIRVDGVSMIDDTKVSVPTGDCFFTCTQQNQSAPVIGINFDLITGDETSSIEKRSTMNFSTTVKMRNQ